MLRRWNTSTFHYNTLLPPSLLTNVDEGGGGGGIRGRRIWGPELFRIKRPTFNCIVFSDGMFNQRAGKRGTPPHFSSTLGNALSSESNQKAERAFSAPPAARNLDTVKTHCENSFSRVQEFSLRVLDEKEMCKKNKCRFSMINLWSCELSLRKRRRDCLVKIINCMWIKACSNLEIGFHSRHWRKKFFQEQPLVSRIIDSKEVLFWSKDHSITHRGRTG